jgi:hypothetical protein
MSENPRLQGEQPFEAKRFGSDDPRFCTVFARALGNPAVLVVDTIIDDTLRDSMDEIMRPLHKG